MKKTRNPHAHIAVRYVGRLAARYTLPEKDVDAAGAVFPCQTAGVSPEMVSLIAPLNAAPGTQVSVHVEELGIIHGYVDAIENDGFRLAVNPEATSQDLLATRIKWVKKFRAQQVSNRRRHKRYIPRRSRAQVVMEDGSIQQCLVRDMSQSGAAVSAARCPVAGANVALGRVEGRVVRIMDDGFAIRFSRILQLNELDDLLFSDISGPDSGEFVYL